jgi:hypothetical protein
LIEDGQDGVLFPPGEPEAILTGLQRAATLGAEARTRARAKAERIASRPAHMRRLNEILEDAEGATRV